jgi:hypothetical protein
VVDTKNYILLYTLLEKMNRPYLPSRNLLISLDYELVMQ